jgi:hypothetical protein
MSTNDTPPTIKAALANLRASLQHLDRVRTATALAISLLEHQQARTETPTRYCECGAAFDGSGGAPVCPQCATANLIK